MVLIAVFDIQTKILSQWDSSMEKMEPLNLRSGYWTLLYVEVLHFHLLVDPSLKQGYYAINFDDALRYYYNSLQCWF